MSKENVVSDINKTNENVQENFTKGDEFKSDDINDKLNEKSKKFSEEEERKLKIEIEANAEKRKVARAESQQRLKDQFMLMSLFFLFVLLFMQLYTLSARNPDLYLINKDTLFTINEAYNAIILLSIPFLFGTLGAIARVLMAGITLAKSVTLILSSGLMGMFSWVGIKSGVLLSLLSPYTQKSNEAQAIATSIESTGASHFYSMALVAIVIGMFSSNVYIFINQKVEQITSQKGNLTRQSR
ncbi:hypothetical protein ACQKP8_26210 [Photobacterium alginatilyticum]|uniref:hypothetical protein n=1 Tax=Photobacterium alginatilyticum TaxID=1775171 RepID=UPI004067C94B